jgi:hypothetical protein
MASDVIVLFTKTTEEEVRALDKDLPSDTHLVFYQEDNTLYVDAVRCYSMVDIFDSFWDKLSTKAEGGEIHSFSIDSIVNGIGTIKPKLFKGL